MNVVARADDPPVPNLQDPSTTREGQAGINVTIRIISFTSTWERSAAVLQMIEALFVFGRDNAGTPGGPATEAALVSEVEQAKAPVTVTVHSYFTIQDVSVPASCHRGSCLGLGSNGPLRLSIG